jgi:hypothetical protein
MFIELNYPEPVPVELDAAKTLLLLIDTENENVHSDGALFIGEKVRKSRRSEGSHRGVRSQYMRMRARCGNAASAARRIRVGTAS